MRRSSISGRWTHCSSSRAESRGPPSSPRGATDAPGGTSDRGAPHHRLHRRLTATGPEAHSAGIFREGTGYGAIYELARILDQFRRELSGTRYLSFNVATVHGGTNLAYDSVAISGSAAGKLNIAAVVALYVTTSRHIRKTYDFPDSPVRAAADSVSLARGRHLVEAIGKCQKCHDADMGGKMWVDKPAFGRLAGPNLTSGRGGIGDFTDADLERALRHGIGRDRQPLIFMPAEAFAPLERRGSRGDDRISPHPAAGGPRDA